MRACGGQAVWALSVTSVENLETVADKGMEALRAAVLTGGSARLRMWAAACLKRVAIDFYDTTDGSYASAARRFRNNDKARLALAQVRACAPSPARRGPGAAGVSARAGAPASSCAPTRQDTELMDALILMVRDRRVKEATPRCLRAPSGRGRRRRLRPPFAPSLPRDACVTR
jgi:hypothetical protein